MLPLLDITVERNAFGRQLDIVRGRPGVPSSATGRSMACSSGRRSSTGSVPTSTSSPAGRRTGRRGPPAERPRHGLPSGACRRDALPPTHGHAGGRARRSRRRRRATAAPDSARRREARPVSGRVRQGPRRAPDRPGGARRAVPAVPAARWPTRARSACRSAARRIGVFSLFRLPLGAFRPHDLLYVYEEEAGLRAWSGSSATVARRMDDRGARRDRRWPRPATSASGSSSTCCATVRSGGRSASTSPAPTTAGNVELFMQAGFARYGEELLLFRPPGEPLPEAWTDARAAEAGIRPALPLDALALARLYATVTPQPVQRLEAYRLGTGSARGPAGGCPRSSLDPDPALRRRRGVRPARRRAAGRTEPGSTRSSRSAWPRRTSPTTSRSSPAPNLTWRPWWSTASG